ncbi:MULTISPECIES: hemin uptake protein HemP [unclassified Simplicispira]|jgi:hemin uptake protein HemP|uniref:hemin uptake protein HemP n=1 Tax=unclassified Simplicispira TaxID=2630407 RepID=UPI000D5DCEE6|nr:MULTISPECIES: hemin uptake protein HemP [unclassified Simplicispira]PVY55144.1 hemin uptake protein HemP [Simplicispira sp. 125]REG16087.1 hemin uptake protein HemP [Simplicispira sp. 110]
MHATTLHLPVLFSQTPPAASPAAVPREDHLPAVESHALLQGQKAVTIHHNGALYRLQATRLGKLILTK